MTDPLQADAVPCSTTITALAEYGLSDGNELVRRTYDDLEEDGFGAFEPTAAYFDRVAATFRALFVELTGTTPVPTVVDAALDDAQYATLQVVDTGSDLETEVLPEFYKQFAGYYCTYRGRLLVVD
ncbi:hypothetical protein E6P09_05615 [Haloferax mediterranei ATCC 33500]|uniref:Uncharacterized protein n=1 Tax=Haloferax mediterranei (strain ATCC 33500 / DSM 1411 / JCM 8866 / NBRC 14739 / NCIMB 2177 / R-4) TaxID=523841 RepID=I3R1Y1_HALMT|nr:hypothetical protein [Haloferax mediterranei]AFK18241.1 hypothetical protein HFX_0514 [Haloferax mediterranei ATCC 33500]AHZ22358.1 hypothetical protein BM92_06705 [Haloferax mediterranei ATCC 33500]EMA02488.1 hypothetical protein C439_07895 [Haloferax mediterranei ATCC 33500]MDX5988329.1 hypothetical protein [Haloferax mediterranei ATCC 33500]QCQ74763.1 hypothetical protein E6P09_05615 [Haloferax mediterranei ATCC 33500]